MAEPKAKKAANKSRKSQPASSGKKHARRTGRRYSDAERQRILEAARREGLSGPKAAKRFGISTLTFYNWRKKEGSAAPRGEGVRTSRGVASDSNIAAFVRQEVRARIAQLIPGIVASELAGALGGPNGRRPRR